jgi:hypothetical protein
MPLIRGYWAIGEYQLKITETLAISRARDYTSITPNSLLELMHIQRTLHKATGLVTPSFHGTPPHSNVVYISSSIRIELHYSITQVSSPRVAIEWLAGLLHMLMVNVSSASTVAPRRLTPYNYRFVTRSNSVICCR